MPRPSPATPQWAETLSLQALGYILGDAEASIRFIELTGVDEQSLRANLTRPDFLAAVLDYLGADEPLLLAFANSQSIDPQSIMQAHAVLSATTGAPPHSSPST
jgi:hypothetical protein